MAGGRELRWPELQIFDNMVSSGCVCLPIGSKQSRHDNAPILNQNAASVICSNRTDISSCNAPLPGFALGLLKVFLQDTERQHQCEPHSSLGRSSPSKTHDVSTNGFLAASHLCLELSVDGHCIDVARCT